MDENLTTAQNLANAGYSYRASLVFQCREVYHLKTGEIMGQMTCFEANDFLRNQES